MVRIHSGLIILALAPLAAAQSRPAFDSDAAARFAELALDCVHREYPNKVSHVMSGDGDAKPPRELTPVFCGCFDWHSAVHGHWLLARLCRVYPDAEFEARARAALAESFTEAKVAAEVDYMRAKGRATFERPYGLAWLLQLCAELREWDDPQAQEWSRTLEPLEREAAERFRTYLPKLSHPVRTGEHSQTAFALGLVFDWAQTRGDSEMVKLVQERARSYYLHDRGANLSFEPDGQAFLSPIIAEADLMRRVLNPVEFAAWLGAFLPDLPVVSTIENASSQDAPGAWLMPAIVTDRSDGHLVHLDGLNLSRTWMLEGIASGLPEGDPRIAGLLASARRHRGAGLAAVGDEHYEGGHWLGSFAVYLVTKRGLPSGDDSQPARP